MEDDDDYDGGGGDDDDGDDGDDDGGGGGGGGDDDDDEKDQMNCSGVCKVIIMCCICYLEWSETRKCLMYCVWKLPALCYGLNFTELFHILLCIIFECEW